MKLRYINLAYFCLLLFLFAMVILLSTLSNGSRPSTIFIIVLTIVATLMFGLVCVFVAFLQERNALRIIRKDLPFINNIEQFLYQINADYNKESDALLRQQDVIERQYDYITDEIASIQWQEEVIYLAGEDPQGAILKAWAGIQQEITRAYRRQSPDLAKSKGGFEEFNSAVEKYLLSTAQELDISVMSLTQMEKVRDTLAHNQNRFDFKPIDIYKYLVSAIFIADILSPLHF